MEKKLDATSLVLVRGCNVFSLKLDGFFSQRRLLSSYFKTLIVFLASPDYGIDCLTKFKVDCRVLGLFDSTFPARYVV